MMNKVNPGVSDAFDKQIANLEKCDIMSHNRNKT